jgi:hypothetical protein
MDVINNINYFEDDLNYCIENNIENEIFDIALSDSQSHFINK